jgi:hypothetical protein
MQIAHYLSGAGTWNEGESSWRKFQLEDKGVCVCLVLDHGMMEKQLEEVCGDWVSLWQIPLGHRDRQEYESGLCGFRLPHTPSGIGGIPRKIFLH